MSPLPSVQPLSRRSLRPALDLPLSSSFPFHKVASISGAGQQHAMVLFSHAALTILSPSHLSPLLPLAPQVIDAFASPLVTNWQDSSTTKECVELEGALPGGREEMVSKTGSKAHERFTGPQILKVSKGQNDVWEQTGRVGIVSSWLATMICLDGNVKGIDEVIPRSTSVYSTRLPLRFLAFNSPTHAE